MRIDCDERGVTNIRDIPDDMGSEAKLNLLVEEDGDVILTLRNPDKKELLSRARVGVGQEISIQFCTGPGGGHHTLITRKLRELVMLLVEEETVKSRGQIRG